MAVAVGYHTMVNGLEGFLFSVGGLAVGIAVFFVPYMMGRMGAGDAKLMGASGAIIGSKGVLIAILFTAAAGGGYALILLLVKRQYLKRFINRNITALKTLVSTGQFIPIPENKDEKKPKLCYGLAIALGTFFYIFLKLSGHEWLA
jgi:prepilin peptidase CpaA